MQHPSSHLNLKKKVIKYICQDAELIVTTLLLTVKTAAPFKGPGQCFSIFTRNTLLSIS